MEHIRVSKVENVHILHHGNPDPGTLHLTAHHLIFRRSNAASTSTPVPGAPPSEIWIAYPIIGSAFRHPPSASAPAHIRLRNRDFSFVTLRFDTERDCRDVFESIKSLTVVRGGVEKLYAFYYQPNSVERKANGWDVYSSEREFERMGVGTERCKGWRISHINKDYSFSPTYPATLVVPASISDTTLTHAKNYRSRARIPVLTYLHALNNCSITRCSQPLTGVRGNRSIQDEKLVAAIFASSQPANCSQTPAYLMPSTPSPNGSSTNLHAAATTPTSDPESPDPSARWYGAQQHNLIVDARPAVNAYAMQAIGMGSENMDNYRHVSSPPCTRQYLGIDNIHVMRDSLHKVVEAIKDSDLTPLPPNRELLAKSGWLKHIGLLLDGASIIVRQVAVEHSHVLVHCSDGWDRTSQLSSLAQLCLDPYFRTIDGFMALVEKDWVSFGHRFQLRCGFLGHDKWFIEKAGTTIAAEDAFFDADDDGGAGEEGGVPPVPSRGAQAFNEAISSARNFFSTVAANAASNGRSSPASDLADPEDAPPPTSAASAATADRATKLAAAAASAHITKPKECSPVFQQFLDATYQLVAQNPQRFEFNERFLRRLLFHLYSCQYGTFLLNNEKERADARVRERTRSVWDYFLARRKMWRNEDYRPDLDEHHANAVLWPKPARAVRWWALCWGRDDAEMNGEPRYLGATGVGASIIPADTKPPAAVVAAASAAAAGVVDGMRGLALGATARGKSPARSPPQEVEMM